METLKQIEDKLKQKMHLAERILCQQALQDLEKQRWVVHQQLRSLDNSPMNWLENGAFISVLPRRYGKTTILESIKTDLLSSGETVYIATPIPPQTFGKKDDCKVLRLPFATCLHGLKTDGVHLLIEEFTMLDSAELNELLSHNWKSVSMFGTFQWKREADYADCFVLPSKNPLERVPGFRYPSSQFGKKYY